MTSTLNNPNDNQRAATEAEKAAIAAGGSAAGTTQATKALMKFTLRTRIGVDSGPLGVTTKTFTNTIDAATLQEANQKAMEIYVDKFGQQPSAFAQFQQTLSLDTGSEAKDSASA